ncbi:MAG: hypothetical protein BGO41_08005 [Clostridiales bacterium 38-18]|nr:MAG: hypothetical protein BGO41_08005 [Clostridiales bacterium 38-18]
MKSKEYTKQLEEYLLEKRNAHFRLAYSYVKNDEDAWDILQDAIVKALRAIHKHQYPEYINSWFYRILINACLDFLRKRKRFISIEETDLETAIDHYQDLDLQQALDNLPTELKTIIILRYFEDQKIGDIAKILDLNENTVKTKLYRSLKLLRMDLEETIYE